MGLAECKTCGKLLRPDEPFYRLKYIAYKGFVSSFITNIVKDEYLCSSCYQRKFKSDGIDEDASKSTSNIYGG